MHQQVPTKRPDLHGGHNGHFIHQRLQGHAHTPIQGDLLNTHLQALPLKLEDPPDQSNDCFDQDIDGCDGLPTKVQRPSPDLL